MKEEGFWVKYYIISGQSEEPSDFEYFYYLYSDGWTKEQENDAEIWKGEAELWAENNGGYGYSRYEYGFEIVDSPPEEWLYKKIEYHISKLKLYKECLEEQT